jgi:hypothetical protein
MCECDSRRGFGLEIGFIDHFNTRLMTTLNYSAISKLHTLQFTRAHAKSFPACCVFISSCLVTAPTMAIPLLLCSSPVWMAAPFQLFILVEVKVTLRLTVSQSVSFGVEPHLGLMTRYLLLFDSYGLVSVGRPLWREEGSVFCICFWPLPVQSIFYCLQFETSIFVASYDSQGHGEDTDSLLRTYGSQLILAPFVFIITPRPTTVENTVFDNTSTVALWVLPQKPVYLRLLPRNASTRNSTMTDYKCNYVFNMK